jgi:hypothetical protein
MAVLQVCSRSGQAVTVQKVRSAVTLQVASKLPAVEPIAGTYRWPPLFCHFPNVQVKVQPPAQGLGYVPAGYSLVLGAWRVAWRLIAM